MAMAGRRDIHWAEREDKAHIRKELTGQARELRLKAGNDRTAGGRHALRKHIGCESLPDLVANVSVVKEGSNVTQVPEVHRAHDGRVNAYDFL
jgi:hypothetical protein